MIFSVKKKRQEQNPKYLQIIFIEQSGFVFTLSTAHVHICSLPFMGSEAINLKEDR